MQSGENTGCSKTSQSSCNNFFQVSKEKWGLALFRWKTAPIQLNNSESFSSATVFYWFNLEQYLSEFNCLISRKEHVRHNTTPNPHGTQHRLLRLIVANFEHSTADGSSDDDIFFRLVIGRDSRIQVFSNLLQRSYGICRESVRCSVSCDLDYFQSEFTFDHHHHHQRLQLCLNFISQHVHFWA